MYPNPMVAALQLRVVTQPMVDPIPILSADNKFDLENMVASEPRINPLPNEVHNSNNDSDVHAKEESLHSGGDGRSQR